MSEMLSQRVLGLAESETLKMARMARVVLVGPGGKPQHHLQNAEISQHAGEHPGCRHSLADQSLRVSDPDRLFPA